MKRIFKNTLLFLLAFGLLIPTIAYAAEYEWRYNEQTGLYDYVPVGSGETSAPAPPPHRTIWRRVYASGNQAAEDGNEEYCAAIVRQIEQGRRHIACGLVCWTNVLYCNDVLGYKTKINIGRVHKLE